MSICLKRFVSTLQPSRGNVSGLSRLSSVLSHRTMSTSDEDDVLFNVKNGQATITLNRPAALNALNLSMIRKIHPQLKKWETGADVKMVIIKQAGEKAFCAGGDVKAICLAGKGSKLGDEFFREEYRLNNQIGSYSLPYVAFLNGIVMGGGVGLSVHGAFRVATEKAVFAMPETAIGFFPDVGGSHFLPRLPGKLGLFLGLTGHRLEGRDLFKAGIATHFCPSSKLPELEEALERLEKPELSKIHQILTKFHEQWESDYYKEFSLKANIGRINSAFGGNSVEEIMGALSKDGSDFSKQQIDKLSKMSPTSLKVTFEEIKRGADLSLADCLRMEYRMAQHCMVNHDFFEGVRALLVDKTQNPKWSPSSLEQVTDDMVKSYFKPLDKELQL
ncbi:3-hydroxyisobutyryl-CoA hydrolase, mitochondrial [Halotydeus destructor]|nr:3-hydroxyisobutyryl-CoA hydrolase, mitochondrial [Halotydeus destructor]